MSALGHWRRLLSRPADFADGPVAEAWFACIACRLLAGCRLVVGGKTHRLVEVEVYYHGPGHPDIFAHRDPIQLHPGRWYFHRSHGQYRGGSFKGLDLSFGGMVNGKPAYGGVLLRGLLDDAGILIDGPSRLVDYVLSKTGHDSVAELDAAIAVRPAWDPTNPLRLHDLPKLEDRVILRTARVGLSLRRVQPGSPGLQFLLRPYRFLSEPGQTAKGKPLMVLALLQRGESPQRIHELTNASLASIRRYAAEYEAGKREANPSEYCGRKLRTVDLCRLHGMMS
jgi:hypothetical protein